MLYFDSRSTQVWQINLDATPQNYCGVINIDFYKVCMRFLRKAF